MNDTIRMYRNHLLILAAIVIAVCLKMLLPNSIDGWYFGNDVYVFGMKTAIIAIIVVLFVDSVIFAHDISCLIKLIIRRTTDERKRMSISKIVVLVISVVCIILAILGLKKITLTDDSITISKNAFSQTTVLYDELQEYILFSIDGEELYWGRKSIITPEGGHLNRHIYDYPLGKTVNAYRLVEQINAASGRELMIPDPL